MAKCPRCGHDTLREDGYYDEDGEWVVTLVGCSNCGYAKAEADRGGMK